MSEMPDISIITPVWNGLPFLRECVESVLMQEHSNWELLISDDGSTDGSREYLSSLDDPRIRVIFQENNRGIFGNLNALFKQAKGTYSQLLCQDDYFTTPQSLGAICSYWNHAPESIAFVRFNYINIRNTAATIFKKGYFPSVIYPQEAALCFYTSGNIPGNLSNISLRTSLVIEVGGFREDLPYAGDFEFWVRLSEKYSFGIQSQHLIYVRRHPGAASNFLNKRGELIRQKAEIVNNLFRRLENQKVYNVFLLKLMGTLVYDALDRWTALKYMIKGNSRYLKALKTSALISDFIFNSHILRWLVFIASMGGRLGRKQFATLLLKQYKEGFIETKISQK